jgi:hypothetical protein
MPQSRVFRPGGGSGGGGGGTSPADDGILVRLHDAYHTVVPATTATLVDGQTIVTGDFVLFTNLASDNNTVQSAAVAAGVITWTIEAVFTGSLTTPTDLDRVSVTEGDEFQNNFYFWSAEDAVFKNLINPTSELTVPALTVNAELFEVDTAFYKAVNVTYFMQRGTKVASGTVWFASNGSSSYTNDDRRLDPSVINVVFNSVMLGAIMKIRVSVTTGGDALSLQQTIRIS